MTATFAIKVETTHDSNGNPRRGWLVYEKPGVCVAFVEEGYAGERALRVAYPEFGPVDGGGVPGDAIVTCILEVTPREWQRIKKAQKTRDAWNRQGFHAE